MGAGRGFCLGRERQLESNFHCLGCQIFNLAPSFSSTVEGRLLLFLLASVYPLASVNGALGSSRWILTGFKQPCKPNRSLFLTFHFLFSCYFLFFIHFTVHTIHHFYVTSSALPEVTMFVYTYFFTI
jgi:hypothetical protein